MQAYKDIDGDSGVEAYEYGEDWIRIKFKHSGTYEYRAARIGALHLDAMKRLADTGDGLSAYINKNPDVKRGYSSRL